MVLEEYVDDVSEVASNVLKQRIPSLKLRGGKGNNNNNNNNVNHHSEIQDAPSLTFKPNASPSKAWEIPSSNDKSPSSPSTPVRDPHHHHHHGGGGGEAMDEEVQYLDYFRVGLFLLLFVAVVASILITVQNLLPFNLFAMRSKMDLRRSSTTTQDNLMNLEEAADAVIEIPIHAIENILLSVELTYREAHPFYDDNNDNAMGMKGEQGLTPTLSNDGKLLLPLKSVLSTIKRVDTKKTEWKDFLDDEFI